MCGGRALAFAFADALCHLAGCGFVRPFSRAPFEVGRGGVGWLVGATIFLIGSAAVRRISCRFGLARRISCLDPSAVMASALDNSRLLATVCCLL